MKITGFDHIVLVVADVSRTIAFYGDLLGMEPKEERPGKWAMYFGSQKISLQSTDNVPEIAKSTATGSGNFCLVTETPLKQVEDQFRSAGVEILAGPAERVGASGPLLSIYLKDPDGNLVEISNQI